MGDTDNTLKVYEGYIDWFPSADALQQYIGKDILFNARVLDSLTNQYSKWTSIPIHIEKVLAIQFIFHCSTLQPGKSLLLVN